MGASRCSASQLFGLALMLLGAPAPANATTQVELTSVLSTGALAGAPPTSRYSGREQRARLVLERQEDGWLPGVQTSARLGLTLTLDELGPSSGVEPSLRDSGSFLRLSWQSSMGFELSLRAFPFDTDYERLGHLHALSWGGTDTARGESIFVAQAGGVPGIELGLRGSGVELDAGLRWASTPSELGTGRRLWAGVLRAAVRPWPALRVDLGLGYFERAALALGGPGANDTSDFVEGGSLRLIWRRGVEEPELSPEPLRPVGRADEALLFPAPPRRGRAMALEGSLLLSRRRVFEAPAVTTLQPAPALALSGSLRGARFAGHAVASWRSLAFVERNSAGLMRGETTPRATLSHPELSLWVGVSAIGGWGLTPSVQLGVLMPAALETPSRLPGYSQTFVVREGGSVAALPVGSARLPVASGRAGLRFQASGTLALVAFVDYEHDANRVRFGAAGAAMRRQFAPPGRAGAGFALKAGF